MTALKNRRKLAAVSRGTPESTKNSRTQNTFDPESTQDYISQVSEGIEVRVTKKLSKEFSQTESRILGALTKLDDFLLNPQVRTCSVAVTTIFWAKVLCSLAAEDACFRMRITLGVVPIRSLVFHVCVPECSRNGFEMRMYLLVREKFV